MIVCSILPHLLEGMKSPHRQTESSRGTRTEDVIILDTRTQDGQPQQDNTDSLFVTLYRDNRRELRRDIVNISE